MNSRQSLVDRVVSDRRGPDCRLLDAVVRRVPAERNRSEDADASYLCRVCGTTYRLHYHVCPECDGGAVEQVQSGPVESSVVRNPRRD